jgi:hypothetical protein
MAGCVGMPEHRSAKIREMTNKSHPATLHEMNGDIMHANCVGSFPRSSTSWVSTGANDLGRACGTYIRFCNMKLLRITLSMIFGSGLSCVNGVCCHGEWKRN